MFWQCKHSGVMNSRSTTLPRKVDRETRCPERPLGPTICRVKSGAEEPALLVVVTGVEAGFDSE